MRSLKLSMVFIALLAATPLAAQSRSVDLYGFVNWVDPSGDSVFDADGLDDARVEFDSAQGFGVAVNVFFSNRVSAEFAASVVEPEVAFRSDNPAFPLLTGGELEMIPITATLQYHFNPDGRFDPYVGLGAAYVLFDQVDELDDVGGVDVDAIDFDDDVGLVVNAGLTFDITPTFALYVDGKYVPVSSSATATFATGPGTSTDIDINPLILSAGLGIQF